MSEPEILRRLAERHPIDLLKVGHVIVGPFGRYELRVTEIDATHIYGIYTKAPPGGYPVGDHCCYPKSDWRFDGGFLFAAALQTAAERGE